MLNGKLVTSGETLNDLVNDLLAKANAHACEICTLYYGDGLTERDVEALVDTLEDTYPDLEYEVVYGGQPLYPYLISLE